MHGLGFQVAVHSNGDFEIDMVLTAMEKAVAAAPRMHRHRLEHASIVNDDILARSKALEIVLAPHSYIYEKGPMIEAYGEEQRLTVDQAYMFIQWAVLSRHLRKIKKAPSHRENMLTSLFCQQTPMMWRRVRSV